MWDLPGPGFKPLSPAVAGRFLTTAPPGKPPFFILKMEVGDFPGGAVVKNRLPTHGTQVRALVQEDPTCRGATKPMRHSYRACALEPTSHNY